MSYFSKRALRWAAPVTLVGALGLAACGNSDDTEAVRVAAPSAAGLGSDQHLNNQAEEIARGAGKAAEPEAGRVGAEVGDADPVQAIEDALRQFPADEVLVVTRRGDEANWLEQDTAEEASERFGVPVIHLVVDAG